MYQNTNITEQRLEDQRNVITKHRLLTDDELEEIQRLARNESTASNDSPPAVEEAAEPTVQATPQPHYIPIYLLTFNQLEMRSAIIRMMQDHTRTQLSAIKTVPKNSFRNQSPMPTLFSKHPNHYYE